MADDGSFTQTGLDEMKAAIRTFPERHTARLRAVAEATATRVMDRARAILSSKTHGTGRTAAQIGPVKEDAANQQFLVTSRAPRGRASNLPWLLEYGTTKMGARAYMRPAADAEDDRYRHDMEAASADEAQKAFGS